MVKLGDILQITGLNATIKIIRFGENRVHTELATFNCYDDFGHCSLDKLEECITLYGEYILKSQTIKDNTITFNI